MLPVSRRKIIGDILMEKKSVSVAFLAEQLSVTEETIRRDLTLLDQEGILVKTHGGAYIDDGLRPVGGASARPIEFLEQKQVIAALAKELIKNEDSVFLDSSSYAEVLARELTNINLTVLTNSLRIINILSNRPGIKLIALGGSYSREFDSFVGNNCSKAINGYFANKFFFSCDTIDFELGLTDTDERVAEIKRNMLEHSSEAYLLVDSSRYDKPSLVELFDPSLLTGIVTDAKPPDEWKTHFDQNNVSVYTPKKAKTKQ